MTEFEQSKNIELKGTEEEVFIINDDIEIDVKIDLDEYGIEPIMVCKKTTYTQAHRKAQQKYREKFPEKYNEAQRKLYDDKKKDDEWKKRFNERSKINNKKYREKKNKEILLNGGELKPKGRPRKVVQEVIDVPISNIDNIEQQSKGTEEQQSKGTEEQEVKKEEIILVEKPKKIKIKKV